MKTMQNNSFPSSRKNSGFTLMEFLIASALAMIVISAAGSTYFITRKLNNNAQKRLDTQQNLRNAASSITRDARNTGSFGCYSSANISNSNKFEFNDFADAEKKLIAITDNADGSSQYSGFGIKVLNASTDFAGAGITTTGLSNIRGGILFIYGKDSAGVAIDDATGNAEISGKQQLPDLNQSIAANSTRAKNTLVMTSCSYAFATHATDQNPRSFKLDNINTKISNLGSNKGEFTLNKLYAAAYIVATINNVPSLLRYDLDPEGKWQGPQLLAQNVTDIKSQFIYTKDCKNDSTNTNDHNKEKFIFTDNELTTDGNLKGLPVGLRLTLNYRYSGTTTDTPYIINATIRAGNVCSTTSPA